MTPRRNRLAREKLDLRQPDLTVLMDGVHKTHNFSAILRSCDAVGVYQAHHVAKHGDKVPISSGTAQGADKWVPVTRHPSVAHAAELLHADGFQLCAANLSEDAVDFRALDYTRPTAFVLGTEKFGVSRAALDLCDHEIIIPMQGWVESLNVSVAAALLLFEAQRQRIDAGHYASRQLDQAAWDKTLFEWLHPKLARHCRQHGLTYPVLDEEGYPPNDWQVR